MPTAREWRQAPPLGTTISGRYRLERLLGAGCESVVYAGSSGAGQQVAIKLLLGGAASSETTEAQPIGGEVLSLRSDHLVPVIQVGVDPDLLLPYVVMPLLVGFDLAQLLARGGVLRPAVAVRIARDGCRGLADAHDGGLVHGNVKPSNLFLAQSVDGTVQVRVLDLGLAPRGEPAGIRAAASSAERAGVDRLDELCDIWAMGQILFEALTGLRPSATMLDAPAGAIVEALEEAAPRLDVRLAEVVERALNRDAEERWLTMRALAAALAPFDLPAQLTAGMLTASRDDHLRSSSPGDTPTAWSVPGVVGDDEAQVDPLLGMTLAGRYQLLRLLGSGGMGAVYEARDRDAGHVAIKVIESRRAGERSTARQRLLREAKAAAGIDSEHVVRVLDVDTDAELRTPFVVMELLCGQDLGEAIRRHGALDPASAVALAIQACRGLEAAHALRLVHRDVKPSNLFLHALPSGELQLKVCDFGVAKQLTDGETSETDLTRSGGVLGSPQYMSPEQARNAKHVDHRSDVWSMGVALYHALSGAPPWQRRETVGEVLLAICTEPLPHLQDAAPWVEQGLTEVVHRALRRRPEERYQSMAALAEALAPHARRQPIEGSLLRAAPSALRSRVAERAGAADSVTEAAAAPAKRPRSSQLRGALLVGAIAAAAALAWVATRRGDDPGLVVPVTPATDTTSEPFQPDGTADAATRIVVEVAVAPADASVVVDGERRRLTAGRLRLEGLAGEVFEVDLSLGSRRIVQRVVITRDGSAAPASLELPPLSVLPPNGTSPALPVGSTAPAELAVPPSSPPSADPIKPAPIEDWH